MKTVQMGKRTTTSFFFGLLAKENYLEYERKPFFDKEKASISKKSETQQEADCMTNKRIKL